MHIHEYQAKEILKNQQIKIPKGQLATKVSQVAKICKKIKGSLWVVKAQAHTGSRGKGGGIVICHNVEEVKNATKKILSKNLITPQTNKKGLPVNAVLIEQGLTIDRAIYLSILINRSSQQISIVTSAQGGSDIEQLATDNPEKINQNFINIKLGLNSKKAKEIGKKLNLNPREFSDILLKLYSIFIKNNCNLLEINPLIVSDNQLIALDCKMEFDDNALFKHNNILTLRDTRQENPKELEALNHGLSYIALDGNIGCMVNGAGLAMATMDLISYYGGKPLNFLDVGGGTTSKKVAKAFELIQTEKKVKAILVNIFGGIVRCDLIANGILQAIDIVGLKVPLVVRLEGTNSQFGLDILNNSKYSIISEHNLIIAAKKVVELAK